MHLCMQSQLANGSVSPIRNRLICCIIRGDQCKRENIMKYLRCLSRNLFGVPVFLIMVICQASVVCGQIGIGSESVTVVAMSLEGNLYATGHLDRTIRIWDLTSDQLLLTIPAPFPEYEGEPGRRLYPTSLAFSTEGGRLAASYGDLGVIRIFDLETGQMLRQFAMGYAGVADWSPDGGRLFSATVMGIGPSAVSLLQIWDTVTGELLDETYLPEPTIFALDLSPDGIRLVCARKSLVVILDSVTLEETLLLEGHSASVVAAQWSPDGSLLATADRFTVRVWDGTTAELVSVFPKNVQDEGRFRLAWSTDGTLLSVSEAASIETWEMATGQTLFLLEAGDNVTGLAWKPDGRLLYASGTLIEYDPAILLTPTPEPTPTS